MHDAMVLQDAHMTMTHHPIIPLCILETVQAYCETCPWKGTQFVLSAEHIEDAYREATQHCATES